MPQLYISAVQSNVLYYYKTFEVNKLQTIYSTSEAASKVAHRLLNSGLTSHPSLKCFSSLCPTIFTDCLAHLANIFEQQCQ